MSTIWGIFYDLHGLYYLYHLYTVILTWVLFRELSTPCIYVIFSLLLFRFSQSKILCDNFFQFPIIGDGNNSICQWAFSNIAHLCRDIPFPDNNYTGNYTILTYSTPEKASYPCLNDTSCHFEQTTYKWPGSIFCCLAI